jgi:CRP/FNR family transcriptional regulator, nitrogen fixation regulation protein
MLRLRSHLNSGIQPTLSTLLKFRKGEIVYAQGDIASDWFEVISGTVRTCHLYCDGHRQLTGFHYPGDIFGIESGHYSSSAEAVTAVVLRRSPRGTGEESRLSATTFVQEVYQSALDKAQACIFLLGRRTATERMAAFLLATAQRFADDKAFALPMSRSDIADHLGLTIHTVSRTLSEFVRRNLIRLDGPQSITILNHAGLSQLANGDEEPNRHGSAMSPLANAHPTDLALQFGS